MKILFALLFATPLLLASCTTENTPGIDPVIPPKVVPVPLSIESATITATTRAGTNPVTESIGVFLSGANYATVSNSEYYSQASTWIPRSSALLLTPDWASVCAYYPFKPTFNDYTAISLYSGGSGEDFCFATNRNVNGVSPNNSTSFVMDHAYAKVTFAFLRNNYIGPCTVSSIELRNLLYSATLNIGTGVYSSTTGVAGKTLAEQGMGSVAVATGSTPTPWLRPVWLIPCTPASSGMEIVLTVDNRTMSTTIPTASYKPTKNEHKTITITINGSDLNVTSVSVANYNYSELPIDSAFD